MDEARPDGMVDLLNGESTPSKAQAKVKSNCNCSNSFEGSHLSGFILLLVHLVVDSGQQRDDRISECCIGGMLRLALRDG